jgi:hypothetical protein
MMDCRLARLLPASEKADVAFCGDGCLFLAAIMPKTAVRPFGFFYCNMGERIFQFISPISSVTFV